MPNDLPEGFQLEDNTPPGGDGGTPNLPSGFQLEEDKYGTPEQTIKAGAESLGRGLLGPLFTGGERSFGVKPQDIAGRQEQLGPVADIALTTAGLVGPALLTGGASEFTQAGWLHAIGEGAGELAQGKIAKAAISAAAANSVYTAGDEWSKRLMSNDPTITHEGIQNAAIKVGLSGLLGAGIGGAIGAVSPLWQATKGAQTADALNAINKETANTTDFLGAAGDTIPEEAKEGVLSGLKQQKPNATEIQEAGSRIGAPVPEGMTSASNTVQNAESSLMKSPSVFGAQREQLYQKGFDAVNNAVSDTLKTDLETPISKAQVGENVYSSLNDKIDAVKGPIDELYNTIRQDTDAVPVNKTSIQRIANNLLDLKAVKITQSSPAAKMIQGIANDLQNVTNVDELREVIGSINSRVAENPTLGHFGTDVRERLSNLQESSIRSFAKTMVAPTPEAQEAISELLNRIDQANSAYGPFKEDLKSLANGLGMGKIGGPQDFLSKLDRTNPEKIVDKIFANKNSRFLEFFSEKFPEEMKAVLDYQKQEILSDATKNGGMNAKTALNKLSKLSPEMQQAMFTPEQLQKLEDSKLWLNNLPKNVNPSDTSKGIAYNRFWENPISAAGMTVGDAGKLAFIKFMGSSNPTSAVGFKAAGDYLTKAADGVKATKNAAEAIFEAGREVLPSHLLPDKESIQRLDKKVEEYGKNPEKLVDIGGSLGHYLPDHAAALASTAGQAVQYLNAKRPKEQIMSPLDKPIPPSKASETAYNRTLEIAEQPLMVLQRIKNGTVIPEDIADLHNLYPQAYKSISNQLTGALINHMSKDKPISLHIKQGLSMLAGQALDSSLTPQGIMAIQGTYINQQMQKQAQSAPVSKTKNLGKVSSSHLTDDQARIQRQQNQKA